MNARITLFLIISFGLLLFCGCETKVDEDWDWSEFSQSPHFSPPHDYDHVGYIIANPETLTNCQECHGADYDGGANGVSCLDCHASYSLYIQTCNRCHGNPDGDSDNPLDQVPTDEGAHITHLTGGDHSKAVDCSACHLLPDSWASQGHIDAPPTEVIFSGLAVKFGATPVWDSDSLKCSNTYCHGNGEPRWEGEDDLDCVSCHGMPPPTPHYIATEQQCEWCHGSVVAYNYVEDRLEIINPDLHINGAVNN